MKFLGLDIGGANIKVSLARSNTITASASYPFALWKQPQDLASKLSAILTQWGPVDRIGATMTGELCDCYATKAEGVRSIVESLERAFRQTTAGPPPRWWSTAGRFVDSASAVEGWLEVAAANWSAAAHWIGGQFPSERVLWVDTGSTTTDLITIANGFPQTRGKTDPERLRSGELIYAGVRRTPLCALMGLEGAAEFFATTDDLFGITGEVPEAADDCDTADGKPRTRHHRLARLARMLGADLATVAEAEIVELAPRLRDRLLGRMIESIKRLEGRLGSPLQRCVVSGSGEFLAHLAAVSALEPPVDCLKASRQWGPEVSSGFCAAALAQLLASEDR